MSRAVRTLDIRREFFEDQPETAAKLIAEHVSTSDKDDLWLIAIISTPDQRRALGDILFNFGGLTPLVEEPEPK